MKQYKSKGDHAGGTCLQGYLTTSFERLRFLFGEPVDSDGYKVSTEWVLESPEGHTVTVYDWKATNLYDGMGPDVETFRASPSYEWHIGAACKEDADQFIAWFRKIK